MPEAIRGNLRTERGQCLLHAAALAVGVSMTQLLHLLDAPLFSHIYYGNYNGMFFGILSALLITALMVFIHKSVKRRVGITPFGAHPPMPLRRRAVLYLMTVLPIVLVSVLLLNFRFKLVYELGDRISKMNMLGNAAGYFRAAARLFAAVYTVFLTERAFSGKKFPVPVGALAVALLYGVPQWLTDPSMLSPVYLLLFFYVGILYKASQKRFGVTYALALVLYIL